MTRTESNCSSPQSRARASLAAVLAGVLLAACASGPPINTSVSYQYPEAAEGVRTYRMEFRGMPEFLKPMLRDEASRVLAMKGLDYTEGDADAVLLLTFDNVPLKSDVAVVEDESGDTTSQVIAARFNARVNLEMTAAVSGERIWTASLGRVHYATEGSYMHESPARVAMRDAFRDVFADFPNRLEATYSDE